MLGGTYVAHPGGVHDVTTVPFEYGKRSDRWFERKGAGIWGGCALGSYGEEARVCLTHRVWTSERLGGWLTLPVGFGTASGG